jgi:glutathione S-transferase
MQLISLPVSPFAARVRIAIYAKGLDVEVIPPPVGWPAARQFRDVNPIGRIPVLVLGDGRVIPESSVIVEFLEDRFADARPLLPTEVHERAKSRLLARIADLYLMPPMVALARPDVDEQRRRRLVEELLEGFATLDALLEGGTYAVADQLSLADCALAPALFAARVTGERLALDVIETCSQVRRYAEYLQHDQHVGRVLAEMDVGLQQLSRDR